MRFLRHRWTVRVCQIALGGVLLAAALPKIGDMASFSGQIHNYRMLPVGAENLLAMTLPWIELVVGLSLVLGLWARSGALVGAGMMVVFLVAIGQAVARGLDIDCGCFGTADGSQVGLARIGEDLLFLALALVGMVRPHRGGA